MAFARISRRSFLKTTSAACVAPLVLETRRPNVLFIQSDQFHHSAIGAAGNPLIQTPHLDQLAAAGVRFENAVCPTPFCSPTRASFLTGLYPHAHGITYNVGDNTPERGIDDRFPTTEGLLYESGWTCRHFGKWHLGDRTRLACYSGQPKETLSKQRVKGSSKFGGENMGRNGLPVEMTEPVLRANRSYDHKGADNTLIGRIDLPGERMAESQITDLAIRELDKIKGGPFFLTVSLSAPHAPWEVGDPYYSLHDRNQISLPKNGHSIEDVDRSTAAFRFGQLLGEEGLREYVGVHYGLISMVDWNIGRMMQALQERGLDDNTLVIFTSDHGDMLGGHGCYDKTTFSMYEETTRVPLIVRWPGKLPRGRVVRTQAGSCDIHPTILDFLGVSYRHSIHGASLRPFLEGDEDLSRPVFSERNRGKTVVQRLIRTLDWKYSYVSTGESQLFHLAEDPGETRNLIVDESARPVREKLHRQLADWMRQTGDSSELTG